MRSGTIVIVIAFAHINDPNDIWMVYYIGSNTLLIVKSPGKIKWYLYLSIWDSYVTPGNISVLKRARQLGWK